MARLPKPRRPRLRGRAINAATEAPPPPASTTPSPESQPEAAKPEAEKPVETAKPKPEKPAKAEKPPKAAKPPGPSRAERREQRKLARAERMERQREANRLAVERTQSRLAAGQAAGPAASEHKPTPAQKSTPTQTAKPAEQRTEPAKKKSAAAKPAKAGAATKRKPPPRAMLIGGGALLLVGGIVALIATGAFEGDDEEPAPLAPVPVVDSIPSPADSGDEGGGGEAAEQLGFPAFATKNTTRVGGTDPTGDAAGVALATYPSAGDAERPAAVTLVGEDDWQAGVAASVLMADPVGAPVLVSGGDEVPAITSQALDALQPEGGNASGGAQVFALGGVAAPDDLDTRRLDTTDPAAAAEAIDRLRSELVGEEPKHIVLTTSEQAGFAMPAAAWAARSGDPVLFATRDQLPKPTAKALKRHEDARVYVLGPSSVISSEVVRKVGKISKQVRRVGGEDPVTNSIDFARYADGSFGWNINDPGHGFVVARSDRPLDAAAAAPLSASGTWGPLLLTDSADTLPGALRGYLLDVKPGYRTDPTRALYNHIWVIGDQEAIDVNQQAALDELAELTRIELPTEAEEPPADDSGGADDDSDDGQGDRPGTDSGAGSGDTSGNAP